MTKKDLLWLRKALSGREKTKKTGGVDTWLKKTQVITSCAVVLLEKTQVISSYFFSNISFIAARLFELFMKILTTSF